MGIGFRDYYEVLAMVPSMLPMLVFFLFFVYAFTRWCSYKDSLDDTQIGVKIMLHTFVALGFHGLLLASVAFLLLQASGDDESAYVAISLAIMSLAIFIVHKRMLSKTNNAQYQAVERMFRGFNIANTAILTIFAVITLPMAFLRGVYGPDDVLPSLVVMGVYGAAWFYQLNRLLKSSQNPA